MEPAATEMLSPDTLARPGGHYSHAARHGDLIFTAGQLGIRADGSHTADLPFEDQVRQALANMLAAVRAGGAGPGGLLKVTAYIVGVENWPRFNAVYADVMGDHRPARTVVPVPELHYGYLIEIDAVAARGVGRSGMKMMSYWLDTAPLFAAGAPGGPEGAADVVVVGGGFTGLSAALALAKKGASVVVLEADRVANAASGRNGGMCNNGFAQDYHGLSTLLGRERANLLYRAFDAGVDKVEAIVAEEGIDCHFQRVGKLKLAAKPEHYDKIARSQELLAREVDPDTRMVPRADLPAEIGSDRYFGGMLFEKSANMHMGLYGQGLAEAAARHGARIHQNNPVTGLRRIAGQRHEVTTPHGSVLANQVLLATGTSRVGPLGWFRRRIIPVGAYIIATEPLSVAQLDRLTPNRRNTTDTRNFVNYFRVLSDNRLLFGGRARFSSRSDAASDAKSGAILRRSMAAVFPELADTRIDYCWGGMVDMTQDRLPHAGERDGLFYSMGYSGHGTQMATYMGAIMAEVLDGRADLNPWDGTAWPAIPGYFGTPWFLPLVGAYYRYQGSGVLTIGRRAQTAA